MNLNPLNPIGKHYQNTESYQWLPITSILILSTVLYFYRINGEGLWLDELTSIQDAQNPATLYSKNLLRPLYYVLLSIWMLFGKSDTWLRSLSVIFAIATIFLLYRLGRKLLGETEGLIAATLMSLSPLFINHAQEIRMYALSTCLGLAGTLCLANILAEESLEDPSHLSLASWCGLRFLAILTVPLNITLLLPDLLIYWFRFRQRRLALIRLAGWLGLLLLLWSPCVLTVVQAASPDSTYASHHPLRTPPGLDNVVRTLKFWTVWPFAIQANVISSAFYKFFTLLIAGLLGLALFQKHRSPQTLWAIAWFVLPLIPIFTFSYISIPIWVNRYLLFVSPYLFIIVAAGLRRLWRQWRIAALVVSLVYLIAVSGGLVRYYTVQDRPDYKFIVQTIEQYEQPDDVVVWSLFAHKEILNHYYQGSADVYRNKTRGVKSDAEISQWLGKFPKVSARIWLVLKTNEKDYPKFEQQLETQYNFEKVFRYEQGSQVFLLTHR